MDLTLDKISEDVDKLKHKQRDSINITSLSNQKPFQNDSYFIVLSIRESR